MSNAQIDGRITMQAPCSAMHLNLFEPLAFKDAAGKPKGEPKYSALFRLKPENPELARIKAKMVEVAKTAFPGVAMADIKFPIKNGEALQKQAQLKARQKGETDEAKLAQRGRDYLGFVCLKAASKFPPALGLLESNEIVEVNEQTKAASAPKFHNGLDVVATFNFVPYEQDGKCGLTAYLDSVMKVGEGERLSGGKRSVSDTFKGYVGIVSNEDPTAGLDDEILF